MTDETKQGSDPSFEEAFKRLDAIAAELDDGNTPLERSFVLFEEGQRLLKICHRMLDQAEKRLKVITETGDGFTIKEESID